MIYWGCRTHKRLFDRWPLLLLSEKSNYGFSKLNCQLAVVLYQNRLFQLVEMGLPYCFNWTFQSPQAVLPSISYPMLTTRNAIWFAYIQPAHYARLTHLQTIAPCRVSNVPGAILDAGHSVSMVARTCQPQTYKWAAELLSRMCGRNWHSTIPVAVSAPRRSGTTSPLFNPHMHRCEQCRWSAFSIIRRRREKCYRNMTISMQIFHSSPSWHFLWPLLVPFFVFARHFKPNIFPIVVCT